MTCESITLNLTSNDVLNILKTDMTGLDISKVGTKTQQDLIQKDNLLDIIQGLIPYYIETPTIVTPEENTELTVITSSPYIDVYGITNGHILTQWELYRKVTQPPIHTYITDTDLTSWVIPFSLIGEYYVRVRYLSLCYKSNWSEYRKFYVTRSKFVVTPELTIEGNPDYINLTPTIQGSEFIVIGGSDNHLYTTWTVIDKTDNTIVWQSVEDSVNLTSITIPSGVLEYSAEYEFTAMYIGSYTYSNVGTLIKSTEQGGDIVGSYPIVPNYPVPVYATDIVTVDNTLYVYALDSYNNNISYLYSPYNNSYTSIPNIPDTDILGTSMIAGTTEAIWCIGGYGLNYVSYNIYKYDLVTQTWIVYDTLPISISHSAIVPLTNGDILLIGGVDSNYNIYGDIKLYNPTTKSLSSIAILPVPLLQAGAVQISNTEILIYGGYDGPNFSNQGWIYDMVNSTFTPISSVSNPTGLLDYTRMVKIDNTTVIVSMEADTLRQYNITTDTWTSIALPSLYVVDGYQGYNIAQYFDTFIVIGGWGFNGVNENMVYTDRVYTYDRTNNTWTSF